MPSECCVGHTQSRSGNGSQDCPNSATMTSCSPHVRFRRAPCETTSRGPSTTAGHSPSCNTQRTQTNHDRRSLKRWQKPLGSARKHPVLLEAGNRCHEPGVPNRILLASQIGSVAARKQTGKTMNSLSQNRKNIKNIRSLRSLI